jgi:hypothetical protein
MVNDGGRHVFVEREGRLESLPERVLEPRNLTVAIKSIARACEHHDAISDLCDEEDQDGSVRARRRSNQP